MQLFLSVLILEHVINVIDVVCVSLYDWMNVDSTDVQSAVGSLPLFARLRLFSLLARLPPPPRLFGCCCSLLAHTGLSYCSILAAGRESVVGEGVEGKKG